MFEHKVIPAVPIPFDARGRIDQDAQERYVRWMAGQRIGGVAVWAHTGRGLRITDHQRAQVLQSWRSGLPQTPIICGVGVPRGVRLPSGPAARTTAVIERTVRLTENAKNGGAQAVMVHPPTALRDMRGLDRRVLDLHRAVAEVGVPVIAFYLYQAAGGIAYSPALVGRVLAIHRVMGIKIATLDSVMTFRSIAAVVRQIPGALLITGEDRFLGHSLMLGAGAALIGLGAACTDVAVDLLDAWFVGDHKRFIAQSGRVDRFAEETFRSPMEGYVQRMLWALEADGVLERGAYDR
ncbi:MAG: dihydrodipicolinate synthase family protein, partial [Gemmatimonadetes bacterium]|nr:dihydrodipicolinate synthase family protein [Gemmatimonadota bacterium]